MQIWSCFCLYRHLIHSRDTTPKNLGVRDFNSLFFRILKVSVWGLEVYFHWRLLFIQTHFSIVCIWVNPLVSHNLSQPYTLLKTLSQQLQTDSGKNMKFIVKYMKTKFWNSEHPVSENCRPRAKSWHIYSYDELCLPHWETPQLPPYYLTTRPLLVKQSSANSWSY